KYSNEDMTFSIGSEYGFRVNREERGFLRAGYEFKEHGNIASGINLGLGLSSNNFFVDYAFSPMGDFGSAHRLSLRIAFKQSEAEKIKARENEEYDFFCLVKELIDDPTTSFAGLPLFASMAKNLGLEKEINSTR
ncbi:MAG: hypothetical protein U9Q34_07360, partial [Elusimicrobiota bacterium]|nr:hypothetical protein [Elusimicrobiota bacterium]